MKGKFIVYSLVAAISIAGIAYFICTDFQVPYTQLITTCTFFFAFFAYSLDHYFDGKNATPQVELHARHQVNTSSYRFSLKGLALTLLVSLYFFYLLPKAYLITGLLVGSLSIIYFALIFKIKIAPILKQVSSAFILTLVTGAWCLIANPNKEQSLLYLLIVFIAILSNLLVFGLLDTNYDISLGTAKHLQLKKRTILLFVYSSVIVIFFLGFIIGIGQSWMFVPLVYAVLLTSFKSSQLQSDGIRIALDLCMLLPMLKWLI